MRYECLYCPFKGSREELLRHFGKEHLCEKCGRFNPDWKEWRWCPKCRGGLAQVLAGVRVKTIKGFKFPFMYGKGRWEKFPRKRR